MRFLMSFIFLFLFSIPSMAGITAGGLVPQITMGGVTISLSQAIILRGYQSIASGYVTLFRSGSAYQVPTGKTLIIVAMRAIGTTSTDGIGLGYGDTSVAGTSAPTNAVTFQNQQSGATAATAGVVYSVNTAQFEAATYASVPALKYPFIYSATGNNAQVTVLGYLQ